ncbi:hypothetical protein RKLH11_2384 [Rhodobacteraceae bacterium KLH11]|nr:hypothetical protein RKLH11_2384 [Rhodobacteraceae bacterium KLH11]
MLTVFARSFMTATRTDAPHIRDTSKSDRRKPRWISAPDWWKEKRTPRI